MRALLVSGPDDLRAALRGSTVFELVTTAARLRPTDPTTAVGATKLALRELARRVQRLEAECRRLDAVLEQLVATKRDRVPRRGEHDRGAVAERQPGSLTVRLVVKVKREPIEQALERASFLGVERRLDAGRCAEALIASASKAGRRQP